MKTLIVDIYEAPSPYPIVTHRFNGATAEEALAYFLAHLRSDTYLQGCTQHSAYKNIACKSVSRWEDDSPAPARVGCSGSCGGACGGSGGTDWCSPCYGYGGFGSTCGCNAGGCLGGCSRKPAFQNAFTSGMARVGDPAGGSVDAFNRGFEQFQFASSPAPIFPVMTPDVAYPLPMPMPRTPAVSFQDAVNQLVNSYMATASPQQLCDMANHLAFVSSVIPCTRY